MTNKTTAKKIASEWHGGQSSALYSFASFSGELPIVTLEAALWEARHELLMFKASDFKPSLAPRLKRELEQLVDYLTLAAEPDQ